MDTENKKTLEANIQFDITKYISFVSNPQSGAIASFSGTTRETFEGKNVVELRYEAYVPMAEHVVHHLGSVPAGNTSVFVAISSVHRDDTLDTCKYVIYKLKASFSIFKKEVYSNGKVWKENREFLEMRDEYISGINVEGGGVCCRNKVKNVPAAKERKSCCRNKIMVRDEES
ncbi:hypothetical protein MKW98_021217 [Papaver atlanticum]|uniref:Molybdopterin synthase n=1 Tax=Papaver atlanticum TaxID=357466 RepID=A0AAD4S9B0_9MAGN|nr:hypothetical protein MKW98_021217 [Papaver atlanticum]